MGESPACLRRSFSQPSSSYNEATEGDHMRALTSSISFGRYMSEPLAWEKWSAFTHNRYMEEVEKYSRPGSVAQMKAYFEAHYKKKAAERATALLEQKVSPNSTSKLKMRTEKENDSPTNYEVVPKYNHVDTKETQQVDALQHDKGREFEDVQVEEVERPILAENHIELSNQLENVKDAGKVSSNQGNKTDIKDGATLGDSASSDKKKPSPLSSTKSTGYSGVPKPPAPPMPTISLPKRRSINASPNGATSGEPVLSDNNKCSLSSTKSMGDSDLLKPPAPPKPTISFPKKTSINSSPNCKKTTTNLTNSKRENSRSLHMSINFASRETDKPMSPILQKIVNSRLGKTLAKAVKDRTTQQPPISASVDISKHPTVTSKRGNNRPRTPLNQSVCESGKVEGKSQSPCIGGSKLPSVCGNRSQSTILSCSFSFKSEERAAKRKEFFERLEQKSKVKETEKEQLEPKLKEKGRLDYKYMHQSTTLKPKPNSKVSQGTEAPSDTSKKVLPMRPCSPKLMRKTPSQLQDINSRPPWRPTAKIDKL